ncbi:MAG: ExeM/NucH family extracellular endonuclease [Microbacter sp.]
MKTKLFFLSILWFAALTCFAQTIQQIQGTSTSSPYLNQTVTTNGIVTAVFTNSNQVGGFFLQSTARTGTASSGIFVYTANNSNFTVAPGDSVVVTGTVTEKNNRTEIDITTLNAVDHQHALPVVEVLFPQDFSNGWENFEGMLLTLNQTLTVTSNSSLAKYGELTLSSQRLFYPTNQYRPLTPKCVAMFASNSTDQLIIANGSTATYPNPIPFIDPLTGVRRTGEKTDHLIGVVDQVGSYYFVYPTQPLTFYGNPRTTAPASVGNCNLKVCSYNLDYYLTSNWGQGYGAANQDQFNKQHGKLLKVLLAIDADVYCLAELQQGQDAIAYMTNALNTATNSQNYQYINDGTTVNGTYIKVGFIYRADKVTPYGSLQSINMSPYNRMKSQAFTLKSNNQRIVLSMNHFKAKTGCPSSGADTDQGDGQGCYNATRISEAAALLKNIPTYTSSAVFNDPDVLILGDLNAYSQEDPVDTMVKAGFIEQLERFMPDTSYSYVYNAQAGDLDHALASPSLNAQITGVTVWHIDSDEPSYIAYDGSGYQDNVYRASDHDPVIVGINLSPTSPIVKTENNNVKITFQPNEKRLSILHSSKGEIKIYSAVGIPVFEKQYDTPDPSFYLSLPSGVYVVKINGETQATSKIIIS